jgi:hypothetical protein
MAAAHEPIHCIAYGDSGAGKSTFLSTFPKPMIVFMFDPFTKETPYLKRGDAKPLIFDEEGGSSREVYSKKGGQLLIRIEYFLNPVPEEPTAYRRFRTRMTAFQDEYDQWASAIVDSVTFMELAARMEQQFIINPRSKEPRQWFAGSTDSLEQMLMMRFASLPMNVGLACHIDEDKDELHGNAIRTISAPGRMRKRMPAGYGEVYRLYAIRENKQQSYWMQTRSDGLYSAASQIGAPDPCAPEYRALWVDA